MPCTSVQREYYIMDSIATSCIFIRVFTREERFTLYQHVGFHIHVNGPELARRSCPSLVPEHYLCVHKTIHTQTDIDTICNKTCRHSTGHGASMLHHVLIVPPAITETRVFDSVQSQTHVFACPISPSVHLHKRPYFISYKVLSVYAMDVTILFGPT